METRVAEVKVVGEVRAVELRDDGGGVFRLRLADGTVVSGEFAADYAEVVTEAFHLHQWSHLGVKGDGEFDDEGALRHIRRANQLQITEPGADPDALVSQDPPDDVLARIFKMADEIREKYPDLDEELALDIEELFDELNAEYPVPEEPAVDVGQHILEMFDELNAEYPVPEEEQPPADFAANYKHYLYGFPKEGGADAASDPPPDSKAEQHILEVFEELRNSPDGQEVAEVWPTDLAANLAHYLYGHPKREI